MVVFMGDGRGLLFPANVHCMVASVMEPASFRGIDKIRNNARNK